MLAENCFNKKIIADKFSNSAKNYDEFATAQKEAAETLFHLTSPYLKADSKILDLGSGSSFLAKKFNQKNNQIFEIDLAFNMLNLWQNRPENILAIQADIENLPFKNNSFDLLVSSFSLQWLNSFDQAFESFYELLKKDGILSFCIPNNESLQELKIASLESGCNFNFNNLPKIEDLLSGLIKAGFVEKNIAEQTLKSEFDHGLQALHSIKKIGANHTKKGKKNISKQHLEKFNNFCLKNFHNKNKKFELSWKVSYLTLIKK